MPHDGEKPSKATKYKLHSVLFGKRQVVGFRAGRGAIDELEKWESEVGVPLGLQAVMKQPVGYSAVSISRQSGVSIVRLAAAGANSSSFVVTADNAVSVGPPSPFSGSGRMNICRPSSWQGDLNVRFPGEEVRLAGRDALALIEPVSPDCH
jgi:hypothetical protein